jgi:hypothetical protein
MNNKIPVTLKVTIIVMIAVFATVVLTCELQTKVTQAIKPDIVNLSGTVTTGNGTSPQQIAFTSKTNGHYYIADAYSGNYLITLPNEDTYMVTLTWKNMSVTQGNLSAGTLNLSSTTSTIIENWKI